MPGIILIVVFACLVVLGILAFGVIQFARGGDPRFRNRIMQARIGAQAVAIVIVLIAIAFTAG